MYKEDPKRCVNWDINSNISPECHITGEEFANFFENQWNSSNNINVEDPLLKSLEILNEDDRKTFSNLLSNDDLIKEAICNKSNM